MKRLVSLALLMVPFVSTAKASAASTPGRAFDELSAALRAGDYRAACDTLSDELLLVRRGLDRVPRAEVLDDCAESFREQLADLEPAGREAVFTRRAVATRRRGGRALVTTEYVRFGLTVRATGLAVLERGQWLVRRAPSGDHVGTDRLLEVPSESMAPTIDPGDYVLSDPVAYRSSRPARDDIVLLHPPQALEGCGVRRRRGQACAKARPGLTAELFLKRVVAGPGDRVSLRRGRVVLNGRPQAEPYVRPCRSRANRCELPRPITVPPGHYFVLGDNRGASQDSRFFGAVPRSSILGRVRPLGPPR